MLRDDDDDDNKKGDENTETSRTVKRDAFRALRDEGGL